MNLKHCFLLHSPIRRTCSYSIGQLLHGFSRDLKPMTFQKGRGEDKFYPMRYSEIPASWTDWIYRRSSQITGSLSRFLLKVSCQPKLTHSKTIKMREIVHLQAGQCGNQIGAKVGIRTFSTLTVYRDFFKDISIRSWRPLRGLSTSCSLHANVRPCVSSSSFKMDYRLFFMRDRRY